MDNLVNLVLEENRIISKFFIKAKVDGEHSLFQTDDLKEAQSTLYQWSEGDFGTEVHIINHNIPERK